MTGRHLRPVPATSLEAAVAARLRRLAEKWKREAVEQRRAHDSLTTAGSLELLELGLLARGFARQLEDCAAEVTALAQDLEVS
jgi:hypothetical protein